MMRSSGFKTRAGAKGASLAVVLILLTLMAWLCVASLRGVVLSERMSGAVYDRSLAFQAAETALREAETLLETKPTFPAAGCLNGLCAQRTDLQSSDIPRWEDSSTPWRTINADLSVDNSGAAIAVGAEFIVEEMGEAPNWPGCDREVPMNDKCLSPRFRITARSVEAGRAQVLLQASVSARH